MWECGVAPQAIGGPVGCPGLKLNSHKLSSQWWSIVTQVRGGKTQPGACLQLGPREVVPSSGRSTPGGPPVFELAACGDSKTHGQWLASLQAGHTNPVQRNSEAVCARWPSEWINGNSSNRSPVGSQRCAYGSLL